MAKKQNIFLLVAVLITLLFVQVIFFIMQDAQAEQYAQSLKVTIRQEITSSNLFLISRSLSDLAESGAIRCVTLEEAESPALYLDLRFKDQCGRPSWTLSGTQVSTEFKTLSGKLFVISFESVNGKYFELSLWLARLFLSAAVFSLVWWQLKQDEIRVKLRELAAQAAHDVASPLSLLNVLLDSNLMPNEAKAYLRMCIERVNGIVGTLHSTSIEIDTGMDEKIERVDVVAILDQLVHEKKTLYENIELKPMLKEIFVAGNYLTLERIISNILNNSIEASCEEQGKIVVSVETSASETSISICDEGVGVPAKYLPQLGTKGFTFGKSEGTGLGLYHAVTSLNKWGGSLDIQNNPFKGATTKIKLKTPPPNPGKTVVFVDNDPLMKATVEVTFGDIEGLGFRVFCSTTEAREFLAEQKVDLLVSDYNLDEQKGTAFIASLKALYPDLKTILLSGEDDGTLSELRGQRIADFVMSKQKNREFFAKVFEILRL